MATNRKRTPRSRKTSSLNQGEINWLYDLDEPLENPWNEHIFMTTIELEELWNRNRDYVLMRWIDNRPCTRPGCWWEFDSPRQVIDGFPADVWNFPAVRQRLGGIGTPNYEVLNYVPSFLLGMPASWVQQRDVDYYNGRAKDIHGNPIVNNKEGDFKGLAIDPDDPPVYESQAAYLQRHNLLTPAELLHLKKHPELLEPEKVTS